MMKHPLSEASPAWVCDLSGGHSTTSPSTELARPRTLSGASPWIASANWKVFPYFAANRL